MSEIKVQPEILSSLRIRADYLALQNPEQTADDIYQIMLLKILEKAEKNLTFLDQKPAYIITYAVWQAKNQAKHDRIYVNFIEDQPDEAYQEEDDNDFNGEPFCLLDDNPSPEETVIRNEIVEKLAQFIWSLAPKNQRILRSILAGNTQAEIAAELGISRPAVTQRLKVISKELNKLHLDLR